MKNKTKTFTSPERGMILLIIDDSKTIRSNIVQILKNQPGITNILEAEDGVHALEILKNKKIDLILSDIIMPHLDGYDLLVKVQNHPDWNEIPIVFLTSKADFDDRMKGLKLGAWDYIIKPANPMELKTRIQVMIRIKTLQNRFKARIHQLERLSVVDGLTGLYNKKYLFEYAKGELDRCKRLGLSISCMMIDVDHFKPINDTHGHLCGDSILKQVGLFLNELIRGYDFAARYGGDEFTILLTHEAHENYVEIISDRIRKTIEEREFMVKLPSKEISLHITVSLGMVTYPDEDIDNHETLLEKADQALYQAKKEGRNRCVYKYNKF